MQEVFEKVIEKLECEYENIKEIYKRTKDMSFYFTFQGVNKAIEIVKKEAEKYNNGWIPCSEPPKTSGYILLSFSNFSVPMVGRYEENDEGGAYYIGDMDETCVQQDLFVNAWKPLPDPYQPNACKDTDCPYNDGNECPAADGCAGYEMKGE